jgi:hypothetical protein
MRLRQSLLSCFQGKIVLPKKPEPVKCSTGHTSALVFAVSFLLLIINPISLIYSIKQNIPLPYSTKSAHKSFWILKDFGVADIG